MLLFTLQKLPRLRNKIPACLGIPGLSKCREKPLRRWRKENNNFLAFWRRAVHATLTKWPITFDTYCVLHKAENKRDPLLLSYKNAAR